MSALTSGVCLNNRFTVRDLIGVGGMSQVWRADDAVLGRAVAVKVLTAAVATDPALRTAMWAEARAAARLAHPHVTQIYDYGQTRLPDGVVLPYLVMELLDGQSLAERIRLAPLPWQQAVTIASQVASALAAAHRCGVVHRDVKPGNVMLTGTGAKVLDFGIAALTGGQADPHGNRVAGTPAYAAPELLRADPPNPASDVYALGALLYESLVGRPPRAIATWRQAVEAYQAGVPITPPDVAGLPRQVRRLCLNCLLPDPEDRPTAEELAHGLALAVGQPPATVAVPPTGTSQPPLTGPLSHSPTVIDPGRSLGRLPRPLLAMLVVAAVVLVAAVFAVGNTVLSGGDEHSAQSGASPSTATTTAAEQPSSTPSSTPSIASPSPESTTTTTAPSIIDRLDATVAEALAAGRIDSDAANSLRDKIKDLSESIGEDNVGEKAQELWKKIRELFAEKKIDQQTANQLITLLKPRGGA